MKSLIRNIATSLLSLTLLSPLVLHADEPTATSNTDIERHAREYHSSHSAGDLLFIDEEALAELEELGIYMTSEIPEENAELANHIIDYATRYLGRPYRSGGKGPAGFDCSGFTSYVFREYGINLNASSSAQYTQGEDLARDEIKPGDLLFFSGSRGGSTVGHVALAVEVDDNGNIKFIHAARRGGIRYDTYPDGGYYSQRYLGARRVIQ